MLLVLTTKRYVQILIKHCYHFNILFLCLREYLIILKRTLQNNKILSEKYRLKRKREVIATVTSSNGTSAFHGQIFVLKAFVKL